VSDPSRERAERVIKALTESVNSIYEDTQDMRRGLAPAQTHADIEEVRALVLQAPFLETVEAQNYKNRMLAILDAWIAEYAKQQQQKN
jgi:hypothetical protein